PWDSDGILNLSQMKVHGTSLSLAYSVVTNILALTWS
ncbi:MAG: hypothetical protein RIT44_1794, partial [Pseudomonadota bacterium]